MKLLILLLTLGCFLIGSASLFVLLMDMTESNESMDIYKRNTLKVVFYTSALLALFFLFSFLRLL